MSRRAVLGVGTSLVVLLVACGGSVSGVGSSGSSSGSSGSSGGSSGTSGGSSGTSGSSGTTTCTTNSQPGDRACVPGTARANVPIQIAVAATDGCLGCFTTFEPCTVSVSGDQITVTMNTKTCTPAGDLACPAVCLLPGTTCTLPGLPAGTYTVEVTGDKPRPGMPPRELVVTAEATATSCTLPNGGVPARIDGNSYAKSCSINEDCALATVGDVCSPCKCPNLAIAKSSLASYQADYRERTSQCPSTDPPVQCAACAPAKATCAIAPDALTGTCTVTSGL